MQTHCGPADRDRVNHRYQADLALMLIENLGIHEAIDICRQNLWSRIQDIFRREQQRQLSY